MMNKFVHAGIVRCRQDTFVSCFVFFMFVNVLFVCAFDHSYPCPFSPTVSQKEKKQTTQHEFANHIQIYRYLHRFATSQ